MRNYDVVKANNLKDLRKIITRKISAGLIPLGSPSVVYMRNKLNERIAVYYQSMALVGVFAY